MKVSEKKWIRFRIYVVGVFLLLGLGTILARAYQLQILERERLGAIARAGYMGTTRLPPKRGAIFDREGHELALSIEVRSIYCHPNRIREKGETARLLSQTLKVRRDKILNLLKSKRSFVWIKRRIAPDRARQVKALDLKGVGVITEIRRYYPGREIAAHLIGFVGTDNQGLEGLEKKYDGLLRGPENSLIRMRDAMGRPFAISRPISSGSGMRDLVLTIDKDIQYKAQAALRSAVKKTRARSGHCLVVNPKTGEILAMAVVPEFNPNIFSKYRPRQWRNRTITDCFEPGSTIKAFLLAACLEKEVITPNTEFDCEQGKYKIGTHVIHDARKRGILSVSDIIMYSSNIGAVKIGQKLGYGTFCEYLRKFGFGSKTGINLVGERKGFIRLAEKAKPIDQATLFFGQGMTTTSLQIAMAMAAIANGGKLMRPYVVKAIVDESGRIVEENSPEVIRRVLSQRTAKKVARILEDVVSDKGTGARAAISGFRVAGKSGTAQKVDSKTKRYSKEKFVATFVGFAPVDHPKLVILVVVDEPKGIFYGGLVAAPVFKEVGQWALNYLRVNPEIRSAGKTTGAFEDTDKGRKLKGPGQADQHFSKMSAGVLPDFRGLGMREVLKTGRSLGLKVLLEGTGLAVKQHPRPGMPLERVGTLKVSFNPPT